jgi:hypothetical protein
MVTQNINYNLPGITPEKLLKIKAYAAKLHKKHPRYKPERLAKKVAEYFNIILMYEDGSSVNAKSNQKKIT